MTGLWLSKFISSYRATPRCRCLCLSSLMPKKTNSGPSPQNTIPTPDYKTTDSMVFMLKGSIPVLIFLLFITHSFSFLGLMDTNTHQPSDARPHSFKLHSNHVKSCNTEYGLPEPHFTTNPDPTAASQRPSARFPFYPEIRSRYTF